NPSSGRLAHLGKPSTLPEEVELVLSRCPLDLEGTNAEARQEIRALLAATELKLDADRNVPGGRRVLGLKRVLAQSPLSCPELEEALFERRPCSVPRRSRHFRAQELGVWRMDGVAQAA